jgi:hypothetical protein
LPFLALEYDLEIAIYVGCVVLGISLVTGVAIFFVNKLNSRT